MIHTFPSLGSYALICLTWCLRTIILMFYWTTIIFKCYLESFSMADSIAFIPPATLKVCHHISTATQSFTLWWKHEKYSKWAAPHRLSRKVCMSSSSVPVAHHWLQQNVFASVGWNTKTKTNTSVSVDQNVWRIQSLHLMPSCYIMKLLETLGSKVTTTPKSSPTLCRMYLFKKKLIVLTFKKD